MLQPDEVVAAGWLSPRQIAAVVAGMTGFSAEADATAGEAESSLTVVYPRGVHDPAPNETALAHATAQPAASAFSRSFEPLLKGHTRMLDVRAGPLVISLQSFHATQSDQRSLQPRGTCGQRPPKDKFRLCARVCAVWGGGRSLACAASPLVQWSSYLTPRTQMMTHERSATVTANVCRLHRNSL